MDRGGAVSQQCFSNPVQPLKGKCAWDQFVAGIFCSFSPNVPREAPVMSLHTHGQFTLELPETEKKRRTSTPPPGLPVTAESCLTQSVCGDAASSSRAAEERSTDWLPRGKLWWCDCPDMGSYHIWAVHVWWLFMYKSCIVGASFGEANQLSAPLKHRYRSQMSPTPPHTHFVWLLVVPGQHNPLYAYATFCQRYIPGVLLMYMSDG